MKLKKKIIGSLAVVMSASALLVGCSNNEENTSYKVNPEKITRKTEKKYGVYKLAFFENRANSDIETQYYTIGYYDNNKLVKKNINSNDNDYKEIIEPNLTTPWVRIQNEDGHTKYYIHRAPYNQYNQPLIKGKVTAKEGN